MSDRSNKFRCCLLFALGTAVLLQPLPVVAKPDISKLETHSIAITARPITSFGPDENGHGVFGRLKWRGGLVLSSTSPYFGGFSGIDLVAGGRQLIAVSDAGFWLTSELDYDGERPKGLTGVKVGPIRALNGRVLVGIKETDAESLALIGGSVSDGQVLISFERQHRIGRFPIREGVLQPPSKYLKLPKYIQRLHDNRGIEAIAVFGKPGRNSKVIAFAEGRRDNRGLLRGWIIGKKKSREIFLTLIDGFDITGLTSLPDGGLLVLERRFRWSEGVKMRLRRIRAKQIKPGAVLNGEILLTADQSFNIDNMEGVTAHSGKDGETVITLISDDNFRFFQRTLLLQFTLLN